MFRIFKGAKGNGLWLIKDGYYHEYKRIIGPIFFRFKIRIAYEN
jgi:hypothetical protein